MVVSNGVIEKIEILPEKGGSEDIDAENKADSGRGAIRKIEKVEKPEEEVEKALAEIPCVVNVLGAMIATGLLRKGLRPTWTEDEKSGLRLYVQKIEWDPENGPSVEADPMGVIRNAFLEGPEGKLTSWRDGIFAELEKK